MKKIKVRKQPALISAIVLAIVSAGLLVVVQQTDGAISDEVIRHTTTTPSETPVPQSYKTPNEQPLSISIPSVDIRGFIQKVGVDQHRAIAAPNNVHLAGWFVDSVKPGQKGLSIIDGHVNGRTQDGVFKNLSRVRSGDLVTVTEAGGKKYTYKVFKTTTLPNKKAAEALFQQDPSVASQLNLITCAGQYDGKTRTYTDRVIVYASLAEL